MSKARIIKGVWKRRVTLAWKNGDAWRTDMFKSVLDDERLRVAEFNLEGGPTVRVAKEELRRVLIGCSDRRDGQIWGPFNIDPKARTIANQEIEMKIVSSE